MGKKRGRRVEPVGALPKGFKGAGGGAEGTSGEGGGGSAVSLAADSSILFLNCALTEGETASFPPGGGLEMEGGPGGGPGGPGGPGGGGGPAEMGVP